MISIPTLILSTLISICTYLFTVDRPSTMEQVFTKVKGSVFVVNSEFGGYGTGFVVQGKSGKLYTITAAHVCGNDRVMMMTKFGRQSEGITVIKVWDKADLCLLTAPSNIEPLQLGEMPSYEDKTYLVSYQYIRVLNGNEGIFLSQEINSFEADWGECKLPYFRLQDVDTEDGDTRKACMHTSSYLLTTNIVQPGASGGPLLNSDGEVIGVTTLQVNEALWTNSVPVTRLREFLSNY